MKELYADIIIDISHEKIDRPFQYLVPEELLDQLEVGMCVMVPFGMGNKLKKGYCVALSDQCNYDRSKIKSIAKISTSEVSVEDKMIRLAGFIKRQYGSTMIQALKTVLPAKVTVKNIERKTLELACDKETLIAALGEAKRKKQVAKVRLLEALLDQPVIPYEWVTGKLNVSTASVKKLETDGIVKLLSQDVYRNPVKFSDRAEDRPTLSADQLKIVDTFEKDYQEGIRTTYLLHGITGSGKTEVYMQLIEGILKQGKQAIVLIPEIALTYQTLLRFYKRFGDRVSVMNSTLSKGEKYDQCLRAQNGDIDVIIGPRSALFTPFPNLGLIIMDEEQESSYKSEGNPKYHARETAIELARLHGASVVLGSATPSLDAYYRAKNGEYKLFTLKERLTGGELPQVEIVDLREELKAGNRSVFSFRLQELLADRLQRGEQSMLFLNRRGYAGFVSCRSCGHVAKCPHCDVSLSEHKNGYLICHYCGYAEKKTPKCPKCGSKFFLGFKAGTQQIEEKLKELFPQVRTLRMDADTTKTKDSYEKVLSAFAEGQADVLIGTQMIVKGHDFPNVTLVGILAADLSLSVGDYRCGERTFQLLTQAVGRAGRGQRPGQAIIQTYQPDHYAVSFAAAQDYEGFYEEEILYRELSGYPPVAHMMGVQIFASTQEAGQQLAQELSDLAKKAEKVQVIGPSPAAIGRINDIFRFVFYVKSEKYDTLVFVKDRLEENIKSRSLQKESVAFDFDPINAF